jgi:arginase
MRKAGRLGLIWIDAHMDAHVPETTPSGNWHGMPLAHLLGRGRPELSRLAGGPAAIEPEHLCLLGARSFEAEEASLLRKLGVSIIDAEEVRREGLRAALARALSIAGHGTIGFGISLDIDAVDPGDAPGVGTPVRHGMAGPALVEALQGTAAVPNFVGIEIVEYNPALDRQGRTRALVAELAVAAVAPGDVGRNIAATIAL